MDDSTTHALMQVATQLPADEREVLIDRVLCHRTYRQIGKDMNLDEVAVEEIDDRAMRRVAMLLGFQRTAA